MSRHEKVWGWEEWIVNDHYCGKKLFLKSKHRCSMHYHKNKDETFYLQSGLVLLETIEDNQTKRTILRPGHSYRIRPNVAHRFTGIWESEIFEFSTHHEDEDSYRLSPSEKLTDLQFNYLDRHVWEQIVNGK